MDEGMNKRLLWMCLLVVAAYWGAGAFVPKPYMANTMSLLAILAGGMMFLRYAETSFYILFRNASTPSGAHIAVLGASIMSLGFVYSGVFSLLWIHLGSNQAWLSTATSSFGRGLMSVGFYMMAISPDTPGATGGKNTELRRWIFTAFAIAVAFTAGTHFGTPE